MLNMITCVKKEHEEKTEAMLVRCPGVKWLKDGGNTWV